MNRTTRAARALAMAASLALLPGLAVAQPRAPAPGSPRFPLNTEPQRPTDVPAEDQRHGDRARDRAPVEPAAAARRRLSRQRPAHRPGARHPQGRARSEAADGPSDDAHQPHHRDARHGDAPEVRREPLDLLHVPQAARRRATTRSRSARPLRRRRIVERPGSVRRQSGSDRRLAPHVRPRRPALHHGRRRRPDAGRAGHQTRSTARCCG